MKITKKDTGIFRETRVSAKPREFRDLRKLMDTRPLAARLDDTSARLHAILVEHGAKFRPMERVLAELECDGGGLRIGSELVKLPRKITPLIERTAKAAQKLDIVQVNLKTGRAEDVADHMMQLGKLLDMIEVTLHEPGVKQLRKGRSTGGKNRAKRHRSKTESRDLAVKTEAEKHGGKHKIRDTVQNLWRSSPPIVVSRSTVARILRVKC